MPTVSPSSLRLTVLVAEKVPRVALLPRRPVPPPEPPSPLDISWKPKPLWKTVEPAARQTEVEVETEEQEKDVPQQVESPQVPHVVVVRSAEDDPAQVLQLVVQEEQ